MSTQKRRLAKSKFKFKIVIPPCDEHEDMIVKSTLPEPVPNQYILSTLEIGHRNLSKCYCCGRNFYEKGYPQEPKKRLPTRKNKTFFCYVYKTFLHNLGIHL